MNFIKALISPFKPFKLKFYIGKTKVGIPYFLPRKWINDPDKVGYMKAIPMKIGVNRCGLGWKTKWENNDYRFEYPPIFSFVMFGYQLAIIVAAPYAERYWTSWLYYERDTDKTKSKKERIEQCKKQFSLTYKISSKGNETIVNYYDLILKKRYIN